MRNNEALREALDLLNEIISEYGVPMSDRIAVVIERAEAACKIGQRCVICGEDRPYTGTCGSDHPEALCNAASKPEPQAQAGEYEAWPDAPDVTYLQVCDEAAEDCSSSFHEHSEVTWCADKINGRAIKYIRAEAIAKKDAALNACVEALSPFDVSKPISFMEWHNRQKDALTQAKEALK